MARRTSQGLWMGGSILPSGTAQPDLPPVEAGVRATRPATREVPLTEWRMVLYATRPKTLSPADPCNKVAPKGTKFAFSMLEAPRLESANSRTVVRVWQSWVTGFSRWQARQVRS